jgi:hypothetical protein
VEEKKYLMWFVYGMLADRLIRDASVAFSTPWTGTASQMGMVTSGLILLILLVAASIAWMRRVQPPNSN